VRDFVYPMFRANAIYEGEYLLGTSIARPLIAKRLDRNRQRKTGADAISHGATGKGNDQVRFELGAYALKPNVKVIAPWREWDLTLPRQRCWPTPEERGIPVDYNKAGKKWRPYSMDANLLHISYEGGVLEDTWISSMKKIRCGAWTVSPEKAPARARPTCRPGLRAVATSSPSTASACRPATVLTDLNRGGRWQAWHRPFGPGGEPLRGHEVPRLLRNPGRHHHAEAPTVPLSPSRWTAKCWPI
jgi:argininosuccinate synthase